MSARASLRLEYLYYCKCVEPAPMLAGGLQSGNWEAMQWSGMAIPMAALA